MACRDHGVTSVADLGGCWGVDGAYLFHAVDNHAVNRAVMVDTHPTEGFMTGAARRPQVELVQGNFGATNSANAVGEVDAVLFYDVLLHQVDPDWHAVFGLYAERVRCILVLNQQWTAAGDGAIRLLDLGPEEYLANVPQSEFHSEALANLDEIHPQHGRPWRDVHHIWQWGITDASLRQTAAECGFREAFYEDLGPFPGLSNFSNRAFLFVADRS